MNSDFRFLMESVMISKLQPCFNGSLQIGTKIIAVVHLVFSIIIVVKLGSYYMRLGGDLISAGLDEEQTSDRKAALAAAWFAVQVIFLFIIVAGTLSVVLNTLLFTGADLHNRTMCTVWFVANVISLMGAFFIARRIMFFGEPESEGAIGLIIAGILFQSYCLCVVWVFLTELKREAEAVKYQIDGNEKAGV